jgi:hypothetical protein
MEAHLLLRKYRTRIIHAHGEECQPEMPNWYPELQRLVETILDFHRRKAALEYASSYTDTHKSPRDASLRVAHLAYRFMNGEDVSLINTEADLASVAREAQKNHTHHKSAENRVPRFLRRKKEQNHG